MTSRPEPSHAESRSCQPCRCSQVAVHLRPEDNVAVAARHAAARPGIQLRRRRAHARPPRRPGPQGRPPADPQGRSRPQYGQIIGFASQDIAGRRARPRPQRLRRRLRARLRLLPRLPAAARRRPSRAPVMGYDRGDGRYGTRNYIAIISTVNCSASTSKYISERFRADRPAQAVSQRRWRRRHHAQGRLRHAVRRPRPQPARPHPGRLRQTSQRRRLHPRRPRLRDGPGDPPHRRRRPDPAQRLRRKKPLVLTIQECGGIRKTVEAGVKAVAELLPRVNDVRRTHAAADKIDPRHQLRRLRRQQRRHGQPRPRRRLRPARRPGRHQHHRRNARDLRRRASADAPGRQPGGRREAGRAHQVVGMVHRHLRRGDQQQPLARQQGRRPDDDLREIARRHRQGRQHRPGGRGRTTPSRCRPRASWSWTRPATIR